MTEESAAVEASTPCHAPHESRLFRAIGHDFRVRTWDEGLTAHLHALLSGLDHGVAPPLDEDRARSRPHGPHAERAAPSCVYEFVDRGHGAPWRYALVRDGVVLKEAHRPSFLLGRLMHAVNESAIASASGRTTIHAAAAQLGSATLILPGAMDAGKSTLVAALVKDGFAYLTDEAVAISGHDLVFPPFAKPIALEEASKRIHADLRPDPHPLVAEWAERAWLVPPTAIRADPVGVAARPTHVVTIRYDPQAGTRLRSVSRAAAVESLARRTFGFSDAGRRHLEVLARVARGARCWSMTVADLDEACALLRAATRKAADA